MEPLVVVEADPVQRLVFGVLVGGEAAAVDELALEGCFPDFARSACCAWTRALKVAWLGAFAGLDETGLVGEHDGLDAVAEVELGEDPVDVCLDGGRLDDELLGDLGVGKPPRE